MQAHVIMMNDSVECVIVGTIEYAEDFMVDRQIAHFHRSPVVYMAPFKGETDWDAYKRMVRWHIRTVDMFTQKA